MSRSAPTDNAVNPCKNWFQWDGGDGKGLKKYNKETKKNDIIPIPFKYLVLDRLYTVVGFNEPEQIGYYSNEIRDLKKDKLTVRSKNGVEAEGTWEEIKAKLGTKGASFCQSVYIAFFEGKSLVLGNIKMNGAALGNWFTFCKENNVEEIGITLKEATSAKKGKVVYYEPVFAPMTIKEDTNNAAIELDKELQTYLKAYLERNQTSAEAPKVETKTESGDAKSNESHEAKATANSNNDFNSVDFTEEEETDMPF